jgi:hypothetical protein
MAIYADFCTISRTKYRRKSENLVSEMEHAGTPASVNSKIRQATRTTKMPNQGKSFGAFCAFCGWKA